MSERNSNCLIFAGPTLTDPAALAAIRRARIKVLPPVKRGDVEQVITERAPGTMAIVDGQFQQCLSVGHAEIRMALEAGWQVWGLSSMGAIRAYEMRHMGMRGFGRVYKCFGRYVDFRDDEVALVHVPHRPYRALSEPLVHLRFWLKELRTIGIIDKREEKQVLNNLVSIWFGERTLTLARLLVLELVPNEADKVDETLKSFDRYRVKCHDLNDFLQERPWL